MEYVLLLSKQVSVRFCVSLSEGYCLLSLFFFFLADWSNNDNNAMINSLRAIVLIIVTVICQRYSEIGSHTPVHTGARPHWNPDWYITKQGERSSSFKTPNLSYLRDCCLVWDCVIPILLVLKNISKNVIMVMGWIRCTVSLPKVTHSQKAANLKSELRQGHSRAHAVDQFAPRAFPTSAIPPEKRSTMKILSPGCES